MYNFIMGPSVDIISAITTSFIYVLGINWMLGGASDITVGVLIAFTAYISRFWAPINTLAGFYNSLLTAISYLERIFELDREFDKRNGYTGVLYQEITDAETIERLHKYDMDAIDMDAEVFIFMEHRPATSHYIELYDVTIRRSWSVEDEEWNENLSQEERDKEMKFVRTCVGLD